MGSATDGGKKLKEKPYLSGELVCLKAMDLENDTKHFASWRRDSEYLRLLDSDPAVMYTPKQMKEFYEKHIDEWHEFTIHTLANNKVIGFVGLSDINWVAGDAWVGIGVGERDFWGQGFGTDAMSLLGDYSFDQLNLRRLTLGVFEYNTRAIRSYEKIGFQIEGRIRKAVFRDGHQWDIICMGVLRSEWEEYKHLLNSSRNRLL